MGVPTKWIAAVLSVTGVLARASGAQADEIPPSPTAPAPEVILPSELETIVPPSPPKAPYTLPFALRGIVPKTGVRLDTTLGLYRLADDTSQITVMILSGQWRVAEPIALQLRWGIDSNQTGSDASRTGILNPAAGVLVGIPIGTDFRFAASIAISIPVATGGGNAPDPNQIAMQREGQIARSAMDNSSFAVNDLGFPTGLSFAYVRRGLTAQLDATVIPSARVKGELTQVDSSKVNSTYGFFVGYLVVRELSLGAELRYQRYITTPAAVARDPSTRDNLSFAIGPRLNIDLTESVMVRPAISYGRGLRGPVEAQSFNIVQLDVPISF